ncbi:unnamed protein product [Meloidogyne enterolobii]|uniref:Uncharacterized protein n=1 Tax=Meloidogyne enterolobii TaxID=390850 RepID=A0ACB0YUL5_MELEN
MSNFISQLKFIDGYFKYTLIWLKSLVNYPRNKVNIKTLPLREWLLGRNFGNALPLAKLKLKYSYISWIRVQRVLVCVSKIVGWILGTML